MHELEDKTIPANFNFAAITELRKEARQSLEKFRPQTLGQASRLEGITPSDLTVLLIHLQGKRAQDLILLTVPAISIGCWPAEVEAIVLVWARPSL